MSDVGDLQDGVDRWIRENGGYWDEMSLLARLVEETGELAREYNHRFGAKKKKVTEKDKAIADEMGDILFILICMANQQGIRLDEALSKVIAKYEIRDAGRFSGN